MPQRADWKTGVNHEGLEAAKVMEGATLRSLPTGAGFKPSWAELAKDRCRERQGKVVMNMAGVDREGEHP